MFRVVRMLRLLRLARLQMVLSSLTDTNSVMLNLILSFVKSVCAIALVVHIVACLWVGIGRNSEEAWAYRTGLMEDGQGMQYSAACHWALTQFTGAFADPWGDHTLAERTFATFALLGGFLMATGFVSNITSLMTQISMVANQQSSQLKSLTRYLQAHNISKRLAERLQRNAQHALRSKTASIPEADIKVLKLVSEPLRKELHFELYQPVLRAHPFFRWLCDDDPAAVRQICHTAVHEISLFEADVLFCPAEVSNLPCMLFLVSGKLVYTQSDEEEEAMQVKPGEWCCEHFLWTKWVYQGMLVAETDARLLAVSARRFQEIMGAGKSKVASYAKEYVRMLNGSGFELSDIGSFTEAENLLQSMHRASGSTAGSGGRDARNRRGSLLGNLMPLGGGGGTEVVPLGGGAG